MGMFDTIKDKIYCPYCGKLSEENEYQTKDLSCSLDGWTISDIIQFVQPNIVNKITIYNECSNCKKWIEIVLDIKRNVKHFMGKK